MFWAFALALKGAHSATEVHPWESRVFYQIFPRSYRDSDGDLVGDFKGIEEGLPTIQKLGCTAILINPIQASPYYHNYFATDFFAPDRAFGALSDFDHLVAKAHKMGVKVVLDMEPQYVATGHKWYQAALRHPGSPEGKHLTTPPSPATASVYWYTHRPVEISSVRLNQPEVVKELKSVFRFWSSHGVDGYRIDHMMDDLDFKGESAQLYRRLWTPIEADIKSRYPGSFFVGEQADWLSYRSVVDMFASTPTDATFNFRLQSALVTLKKGIVAKGLEDYRWFTKEGRFQLNFLENHDMDRFASEETNPLRQRAAAAIFLLAKGAPIIYYGQELGMKGEQGRWGSDGNDVPVRLAYRWGKALDTPGTARWYKGTWPWANTPFEKNNDGSSLEEQENVPNSLFNWYRRLIAIRRANPALSTGTQDIFELNSETVLAFRRQSAHQSMVILVNLSESSTDLTPETLPSGSNLLVEGKEPAANMAHFEPWQVKVIAEGTRGSASKG